MESSATASPIISRSELATAFSKGCKPACDWRIGTEHEKFAFHISSQQALDYADIACLFDALASKGWNPVYEQGKIIALQRNAASITLEPGGQIELSGAPLASIHETCAEVARHHEALKAISTQHGFAFLGAGFHPTILRDHVPLMPKKRYDVMRAYMPKVGTQGLDMMLRTATVQANLDFASEADMAKKMRIACCLQPLVTALFAASPFKEGKPSGLLSTRAACWLDTDPHRTGVPSCVFDDDFGFEAWTEWVLDVPMYFVLRGGAYINCTGLSFRDFLEGKLAALPGERPTMDDWELHISTTFPEVRLKTFLEMRGADAGSKEHICALPALWKGLLYDEASMQQAWDMIADWSEGEVSALRREVPRTALATPFRDSHVQALCEQMLDISLAGLARLQQCNAAGEDERKFLAPIVRIPERGETLAEHWLKLYHGAWQGDIRPMFDEARH